MPKFSLYERFTNQGTLSEEKGIPDPRYSLPSTVHWMRAYAILIKAEKFHFNKAKKFYGSVIKKKMEPKEENSIFEHLLLAIHQLSALKKMSQVECKADVARVASVAWYYGIYANISAMVVAQDGSIQDNHTKTANVWDRQFVETKKVLHPFDLRISTLVKKDAIAEIDNYRKGPKANLVNEPTNVSEAHQAICGYLSGTRKWWACRVEEELKEKSEFLDLGVKNFRTKAAQNLRDARLQKHTISFAHQAIRFRGKANYREALYLAHGRTVESTISGFVSDMVILLEAFTAMAGAFCFARLGVKLKDDFLNDLEKNRSFSLDPQDIWS